VVGDAAPAVQARFGETGCDLRALADVQEPLIAIKLATV